MKKLNRWLLLNLGLLVVGTLILGIQFLVVAEEDKERLVLMFVLTVVGGGAILVGLFGLSVQALRPLLSKPKGSIQSPEPMPLKRHGSS
jgi:hypothetical protein